MKVILSRKGFDSAAGGVASPIFDDGTMISLPIPSKHAPIRYDQITHGGHDIGRVVADLTGRAIRGSATAHLDPDLVPTALRTRDRGWRGLFGQAHNAQQVLAGAGVGPGDLFLFFGWFRRATQYDGTYRYAKASKSIHALWGWMQIERVIDVARAGRGDIPAWAAYHPHVAQGEHMTHNTLYVARERLALGGRDLDLPGSGVFPRYADHLCLTKAGASRSLWSLPRWFEPRGRPPLGAHARASRWTAAGDRVDLQSVARGQEFVLDVDHYPEALAWSHDLIARGVAAGNAAPTPEHRGP